MITEKEIEEARLSPTKKDYYQIWNELMEMTTKLSNLWNPGMTNESDPGVVLLKVLTGVGDKLSYNIDKATLEHFLPSATQVESVRALCETLGYGMKYYRGATCDVNISFNSSSSVDFSTDLPDGVWFPKFTNIKNIDMDVNYVTLEEFTLSLAESRAIPCMEGALVECISDNDNIITLAQLDTQNRFIFPESNVAENGIFVTNIVNGGESSPWEQVDNLNARIMGSKVYKFGFDSKRHLPYIQFTDEISNLIEDGLKISYVRTNGYAGNVSANTLTVLEPPAIWATSNDSVINKLTAEDFVVSNYAASLNGQDPETIDSAYINFKKTVGTFDTLVACRDYIAAIYKMTVNEYNSTPLVSAINVTDIRDDLNSAMTLCSFSEYGIKYSDRSVQHYEVLAKIDKLETSGKLIWRDLRNKFGTLYKYTGTQYAPIDENDFGAATAGTLEVFRSCAAIDRFDLVLYPFYTIYNVNNKTEFDKSFKFGTEYESEILTNLGENKTLAHNIKFGNYAIGNIAAIKNYVRLHCKVTTVRRVTSAEERELLDNIYKALYANFNARKVDFGEEIPYDSLVKVITEADARIKDIMLEDPTLITKILSTDNQEYALAAADATSLSQDAKVANALFNRLVLRNVLAGKIAAFDYNTDFVSSYTETKYGNYATSYPVESNKIITSIESSFTLPAQNTEYKLEENEVVRFTLPNFKTTKIFPAYVNYYFHKNTGTSSTEARPAKMESILEYLSCTNKTDATASIVAWTTRAQTFMEHMKAANCLSEIDEWNVPNKADVVDTLDKLLARGELLYIEKERAITPTAEGETPVLAEGETPIGRNCVLVTKLGGGASDLFTNPNKKFNLEDFVTVNRRTPVTIYKVIVEEKLSSINNYFIELEQTDSEIKIDDLYANSRGLYIRKTQKLGATAGNLVDEDGWKYARCTAKVSGTSQYTQYFVPMATYIDGTFAYNGLGKDPIYRGEAKNADYLLGQGDYLLINYTSSTTDADGNETKQVHNEVYESTPNNPVYIKANFDLIDSKEYHQTHSYSKEDKNGQEFSFDINYLGPNEGMFTLGSNEQIEIREPVRVELGKLDDPETGETDSGIWNICWSRLDDSVNMLDLSQIEFVYNEWINLENETRWTEPAGNQSVDKTQTPVDDKLPAYNAYTLKAGEYFYVTDSKKQNLIYYGSGTTIVRHQKTPRLVKLVGDVEPSATDVANYGLAASLPFHTYLLKNPSTVSADKRSIIIQENQMIVLTEGDKLIGLQKYNDDGTPPMNPTSSPTVIEAALSTSTPINVYSARYKFAEAEVAENLPKAPAGLMWSGTSTLDININPDKPQKLNYNDKITLNFTEGNPQVLTASNTNGKLTLYSSYPCVTANSVLGTELRDVDGNIVDYGLKLRVSKTVPVEIANSALNMNNYSNKWTKLNFVNYKEICGGTAASGKFKLQIGISDADAFGLIMFYYINKHETDVSIESTDQCNIEVTEVSSGSKAKISLMSANTDTMVNTIYLSPGSDGMGKLNIIKVDKTVTELTVTPDTDFNSILVFGQLDAVKGINPKLDYRAVSDDTTLRQLLNDIKRTGLADEFYYNVPVEHAQAIDLNANIDDEKLSSPATWYDNNNVNKKFVISEIDTNYLSTGITLTKQSKG